MPHETLLCHLGSSSCFGQCRWVRFSKLHCDCCVGFFYPTPYFWMKDNGLVSFLILPGSKHGINSIRTKRGRKWPELASRRFDGCSHVRESSHDSSSKHDFQLFPLAPQKVQKGRVLICLAVKLWTVTKKLTTDNKKQFGGGEKNVTWASVDGIFWLFRL